MSGGSGHSDQSRVWADIQDTMDGMNLNSDTGSLPEAYEKAESLLEQFRKKVNMPAGCRGDKRVDDISKAAMDLRRAGSGKGTAE